MAPRANIACILGEGFEDSEFRIPYDRLRNEGFQVDIIGIAFSRAFLEALGVTTGPEKGKARPEARAH